MKQNNQENNNIIFGILKARGIPTGGFGRVLARKAKTGEKFWSAGSTSLTPQNDRAEDADRGAVRVPRNCRQGTRGEGDDGDDDTCVNFRAYPYFKTITAFQLMLRFLNISWF